MSNRKVRVGELLKREISDILHTRMRGQSTLITITEVDVSPDNKNAKVFYSVIETEESSIGGAKRFLERNLYLIKREVGKRIVLKYMPAIEFVFDEKNRAANRVNELLDELEIPENTTEKPSEDDR